MRRRVQAHLYRGFASMQCVVATAVVGRWANRFRVGSADPDNACVAQMQQLSRLSRVSVTE